MRGLIIGVEPIDQILAGIKPWEIRGRNTEIRGKIALIKKGTKTVVGTANLVDVLGPLSIEELRVNADKHQPTPEELEHGCGYEKHYAWVLEDIVVLDEPVPYEHPSGAVIWVTLADDLLN